MTIVPRCLLLAVLAVPLAGCSGLMTDSPYPVTDNGPNPAPLPGYRVRCETAAAPLDPLFYLYSTGCRQEFAPVEERPVIRARS